MHWAIYLCLLASMYVRVLHGELEMEQHLKDSPPDQQTSVLSSWRKLLCLLSFTDVVLQIKVSHNWKQNVQLVKLIWTLKVYF